MDSVTAQATLASRSCKCGSFILRFSETLYVTNDSNTKSAFFKCTFSMEGPKRKYTTMMKIIGSYKIGVP